MAAPRPEPSNFSSFDGPRMESRLEDSAGTAAGSALALLQVLYSYSGWENANYVRHPEAEVERELGADGLQVLTEVRNPPRTLRKAAPIAISAVTVLYVLANISYVRTNISFLAFRVGN